MMHPTSEKNYIKLAFYILGTQNQLKCIAKEKTMYKIKKGHWKFLSQVHGHYLEPDILL